MTTTPLQRAEWAFHEAGRLAGRFPYVYSGAHGVPPDTAFGTFPPTKGTFDPEGTNPDGYDCSSWAAAVLWYAGMLGSGSLHDTREAPNTEALEGWGEAGIGKYVTLYVRDSGGIHHCLLRFTMLGHPVMWSAGAHTGTICGWQPYTSNYDPTKEGYATRHFPGT